MINIQIIDSANQIQPTLFTAEANVKLHGDEVQALNHIEAEQPSVILLNYALRNIDTPNYIHLIQKNSVESQVVVIGDGLSEQEIINCLLAGAKGYVELTQLELYAKKLLKVINAGEAWISRRMVSVLLDSLRENG